MKEKKKIIILLIAVLISILIATIIEIYYNRDVLLKNEFYQAEIVEKKDIEQDGKWYKTTSDEAYIVLKLKSNYVSKIYFEYQAKDSFQWELECNNAKSTQNSTNIMNIAERPMKSEIKNNEITIRFKSENIKFKDVSINNKIEINFSRVFVIISTIIGITLLVLNRKYFYKNLDKAFLFISLLSGILMMNILPKLVFISWDDQIHLRNSYTYLASENAKVPYTVLNQRAYEKNFINTKTEEKAYYDGLTKIQNEEWQDYSINNYSPKYNRMIYLPFTIGLQIGNLLNLSYATTIILAKLLNFICYVMLMFFAIKVATSLKKVIFVIGLFVTNIFISTQFSYDPTIIASMILATSLFYRLLEEEKINKKYLFAFIACVIWASLPKAIYSPMLLLLLFIPNKKFANKKQAYIFKTTITIVTILLMATFVLPTITGSMGSDPRGGDTSVSKQLAFILKNPINYAIIVIKYFMVSSKSLIMDHPMSIVYINDYVDMIAPTVIIINYMLLLYCLFTEKASKSVINNKMKAVFTIAVAGISILIVTSMYLSFTPVGSSQINGVQVRYFTPLLLLGLLIFIPTTKKKITEVKNNNIVLLLVPFISLMAVCFLMANYGIAI